MNETYFPEKFDISRYLTSKLSKFGCFLTIRQSIQCILVKKLDRLQKFKNIWHSISKLEISGRKGRTAVVFSKRETPVQSGRVGTYATGLLNNYMRIWHWQDVPIIIYVFHQRDYHIAIYTFAIDDISINLILNNYYHFFILRKLWSLYYFQYSVTLCLENYIFHE